MDEALTPRRARLSLIRATRARSGRLLNCSPSAAKGFSSPLNGGDLNIKRSRYSTPLRRSGIPNIATPNTPTSKPFDFCGIDPKIRAVYEKQRKIKDLYEWQKDCLSRHYILRGSNVVISLPTGAGKTLIAEILMLREVMVKKRSCILILPYVAIVQEKINSLMFFESEFGIHIEEYAATKGRIPPIKRRKGLSIYVATIEKANSLVNSLIENKLLETIGLVVVDEFHMINEGSRGASMERLVTKVLHAGVCQIVGISATISNMSQLASFIRGYVYTTDFRPVKLSEFVRMEQILYRVNSETGELKFEANLPQNKLKATDPDGVCQFLEGVIPKKSVLIFCPTKKNCENVALMIAKIVPKEVRNKSSGERQKMITAIKEENDGIINEQMMYCLSHGIAYHHSGLTQEERKHVEVGFSDGIISVICATSTLAAGVNLPARRVIIKSPTVGMEYLKKSQYLQMIGRAGRAGLDEKGDSIIIIRPGLETMKFKEMRESPLTSCQSTLNEMDNFLPLVIEIFALKIAKTIDDALIVLENTLLHTQNELSLVRELLEEAIKILLKEELITVDKETDAYICTPLGYSSFKANFCPSEIKTVINQLQLSLNSGIVFSSHFHLLFMIVPHDIDCNVDWTVLHNEYKLLTDGERAVLSRMGLSENVIIRAISGQQKRNSDIVRIYVAMLLQRVWKMEPHIAVADKFGIDRGWLQSLLQNTICQAAAIAKFAEAQAELWPLKFLLPELVQRLSDCVMTEIVPLLAIDGVKKKRARQLYTAGYRTVNAVSKMSVNDLRDCLGPMRNDQCNKIINSAKTIVRDQIDEKMEEISELGLDIQQLVVDDKPT